MWEKIIINKLINETGIKINVLKFRSATFVANVMFLETHVVFISSQATEKKLIVHVTKGKRDGQTNGCTYV